MKDDRKDAPEPARAPDPYQARFMAEGALYYDKIRAPRLYHVIFLLPLVVILAGAIAAAAASGPAAAIPAAISFLILPIFWLLFSVLRISVTPTEVFVQYGLFGPKIAVRDITHCAAVDYDWKKYGGWGIRYGRDGSVAYNMLGDHGRAVEITYTKGGKPKKVLVASPDPVRLAAAVNKAREMALEGEAPKRIAAAPPVDDITREAEAEAEAIAAEAEAEAQREAK